MENQQMNRLAAAYRADLLYAVERAKQGNCAPCWQDYCMEELAAAKDTGAYPQDGDDLRAELQRLTATVPQITNREAEAAELAAYGGKLLFYLVVTAAHWSSWPICPRRADTAPAPT